MIPKLLFTAVRAGIRLHRNRMDRAVHGTDAAADTFIIADPHRLPVGKDDAHGAMMPAYSGSTGDSSVC